MQIPEQDVMKAMRIVAKLIERDGEWLMPIFLKLEVEAQALATRKAGMERVRAFLKRDDGLIG